MIKNFLLFLFATILFSVLGPIGLVYGLVTRARFGISAFFLSMAIGIDQLGNVFAQYLFDDIMITKDGVRFGDEDKTISWTLGMNKKKGTLKWTGKLLCKILGYIDKDHCIKSAVGDKIDPQLNQTKNDI